MKDFIPYPEALAIRELGFNERCFGYYDNTVIRGWLFDTDLKPETLLFAPTYSQAFRFFREKYSLKIYFAYWNGYNGEITEDMGAYQYECYVIPQNSMSIMVRSEDGNLYFKNYEEAELACLRKLIEIVKNQSI